MSLVIAKVIPIILLILLGYICQLKKLVDDNTMHIVKKAVINIALPSVLFLTFKSMELKVEYLLITLIVFVMLYVFYLLGVLLNKIKAFNHDVLPYLMTGYAFGLLGIPLFGAVYGAENLGIISVFGIAHELFVWFVYISIIRQKLNNEKFSLATIKKFLKSPLIIAILLGLAINFTGMNIYFDSNFLLKGLENTLSYLAGTATPVILIVIGYGLKLETKYIKTSFKLLVLRLFVTLTIGYLVKLILINPIVGDVSPMYNVAYFTFLIMPPPFSLAIFVSEYSSKENAIITNNTIVLSTIVSVVVFLIFSLLTKI